ncbi:MAG: hypothetical protein PVF43_08645 [Candidatus Eiseniibacteriota bacterium]|jgi:hypothetical protein
MRRFHWIIAAGLLGPLALPAARAAAAPELVWDDLYDGGAAQSDVAVAGAIDPAGDLLVAGESADGIGGVDLLVRRLDRSTGETLWSRRIAAVDDNDMAVAGVELDGAGDLLVGATRLGCFG